MTNAELADEDFVRRLGQRPQDTWTPLEVWRLWGIAALRQPSSDQVLVPREPTDVIVWAICEHGESVRERCNRCPREIHIPGFDTGVQGCRAIAEEQYHAMLSAAEDGVSKP